MERDAPANLEGRRLMESLAAGIAVIALLLGGGVFVIQRSMMYPGTMRAHAPAPPPLPGLVPLWLEQPAGRVEAWLLPAQRGAGPRPLLVFAHGNGELIDDWPGAFTRIPDLGIGVLLVEYPGYGRSAGKPSQDSIAAVMRSAYDAAVARSDVDPNAVVLYGRSLGGGAVATLLGHREVAGLILQSTFTSAADLAWDLFKAPGWLVRDPYPTREALERYEGPTLVIHGEADDVIPYAHGQALQRAARDAELITYACRHNDCPPSWPAFWRDIERFLRANEILKDAQSNESS